MATLAAIAAPSNSRGQLLLDFYVHANWSREQVLPWSHLQVHSQTMLMKHLAAAEAQFRSEVAV